MESCSWLLPEMRVVECMDCPWYLAFAGEREWLRGEGCNGKGLREWGVRRGREWWDV